MALTQFGEQTKTLFLKGIEMHKLHHEFEVATAASIKKGQPVKLNAAGEVIPAVANEPARNIIGYSIHNGEAGELVTVGMKAFAIVWASPEAAVDAGPVAYNGQNTTDPYYPAVVATTGTAGTSTQEEEMGWALDQATAADDLIRVAIY